MLSVFYFIGKNGILPACRLPAGRQGRQGRKKLEKTPLFHY